MSRIASICLTTQLLQPASPCWSKQYGNTPVLFPSGLRLCNGAVSNPVFGLLAGLFLLVVCFSTSSVMCTTNTYVLLSTNVNSKNFTWSATGWDRWPSGCVPIDRPRVWVLVEPRDQVGYEYSFRGMFGVSRGYLRYSCLIWNIILGNKSPEKELT